MKEGDLLFRIDPGAVRRPTAARARAELGVQQANLQNATRDRDRVVSLYEQKLVSVRDRDTAIAACESAIGRRLRPPKPHSKSAELDLSYTNVRAPISGLTSREVRSEGSLVTAGADSSLLTHIVQSDRLYVQFARAGCGSRQHPRAPTRTRRRAGDRRRARHRRAMCSPRARSVEFIAPRVGEPDRHGRGSRACSTTARTCCPGQVVRARVEGVQRRRARS